MSFIIPPTRRQIPRDSRLTDDFGLICRWHETCFDLQTGEARNWLPKLQADGTSPGWEFLRDISKNRAPMKSLPWLVNERRRALAGARMIAGALTIRLQPSYHALSHAG